MRRAHPLIVGGGPAGAAAAIRLARAGRRPLLLERQREVGDALCGGFLSWRTLAQLEAIGIDPARLNPATVTQLRLFAGSSIATAALPAPAKGVSRHRLDTMLLAMAARSGATIDHGVRVRAIEGEEVALGDGGTIRADGIFLATGKHDLRGHARPVEARGRDPVLGLRVRLQPDRPTASALAGTIELHCFRRGYAGIVLQEDGSANICLAIHRSQLDAAGGPYALLVRLGSTYPVFGDRIAQLTSSTPTDAVANVPYGWRATETVTGLYRLGDQAAVIPSLAGEGIGIALASAQAAANAYLRGATDSFQVAFARTARRPLLVAGLAWRLAEHPAGAQLLARTMRFAPGLADTVARLTRIREIPIDATIRAPQI